MLVVPNERVPARLVTATVLLCLATTACRERAPAPPAGPPPTIELRPGALFIAGKSMGLPDAGTLFLQSEELRQAMTEALKQELAKEPVVVVGAAVDYGALHEAFTLTIRMYEKLMDSRRPKRAADTPCCSECDLVTPIRVRLRCSGNEREWEVRGPTFGSGAGFLDRPPELLFIVAATSRGFHLAATGGVLPGLTIDAGPPGEGVLVIPRVNGALDFAALETRVALVKAKFPNEKELTFAADGPEVRAVDVCRMLGAVVPYFPDVVLGSF